MELHLVIASCQGGPHKTLHAGGYIEIQICLCVVLFGAFKGVKGFDGYHCLTLSTHSGWCHC